MISYNATYMHIIRENTSRRGATSGAGTVYTSGQHAFKHGFFSGVRVARLLV